MDEEIVVDDVDDNSITESQLDDSTTPVMPLLYIQQGKMRSAQTTAANQTLVSPTATQLAAIINPVNNQVIFLHQTFTYISLKIIILLFFLTFGISISTLRK